MSKPKFQVGDLVIRSPSARGAPQPGAGLVVLCSPSPTHGSWSNIYWFAESLIRGCYASEELIKLEIPDE
jgi:hypothetical protein